MRSFEVCAIFSSIDHAPLWHDCLQIQVDEQKEAISLAMTEMAQLQHFDDRLDPYRVIYGVELVQAEIEVKELEAEML